MNIKNFITKSYLTLQIAALTLMPTAKAAAQNKAPDKKLFSVSYGLENMSYQWTNFSGSHVSYNNMPLRGVTAEYGNGSRDYYAGFLGANGGSFIDEDLQKRKSDKQIGVSYDLPVFKLFAGTDKKLSFPNRFNAELRREFEYSLTEIKTYYPRFIYIDPDQSVASIYQAEDHRPEKANRYDMHQLAMQFRLTKDFKKKRAYAKVSAAGGPGLGLDIADWTWRPDYAHPISFMHLNLNAVFDVRVLAGIKICKNLNAEISGGTKFSKSLAAAQLDFCPQGIYGGQYVKDAIISTAYVSFRIKFQ